MANKGPASERLRQWRQNYIEEHIDNVPSWPATCPCKTKVEDANSIRHHLSDAHGYWKAEWRMFGRKRASEGDKNEVHQESTPNPEDACETKPCKGRKRAKPGDKSIEWSPPCEAQSPDPPSSRQQRPDRRKASDNVVASHEGTPTKTASTSWFPTAIAGSSDPSGGQCGGCCPDEPGLDAPSSPNHYPDPGWDSPSATAVGDEEEVPDRQRMLELLPQSDHPSDGVLGEDCTDDALGLENISWPKDSPKSHAGVRTWH